MKTQVVIIGSGPSGLLLSEILSQNGIDNIVLEKHTRAHLLGRVRAGVMAPATVAFLNTYGLGERLNTMGTKRDGFEIVWGKANTISIDINHHTKHQLTVYGQSQLQEDLFAAADQRDATIFHEVTQVRLINLDADSPQVKFLHQGMEISIDCDFIAGCDGFHGIARKTISNASKRVFAKTYPFNWLGILSQSRPLNQITYSHHQRGFALASARNAMISRYYLQVPVATDIKEWSDDRIWSELMCRYPQAIAENIIPGAAIEKSMASLFCFFVDPIQYGRLFLVGDAAHILPPTGAKGLNLAISDVACLSRALVAFYHQMLTTPLESYTHTVLQHVNRSMSTALYMTNLLHRFPKGNQHDIKKQYQQLNALQASNSLQAALAKSYVTG